VGAEAVAALDKFEGVASGHYLPAHVNDSKHEIQGILTYIASDNAAANLRRPGYMEKIIKAAKMAKLSKGYIQRLQEIADNSKVL
jgi:hypothetical protein